MQRPKAKAKRCQGQWAEGKGKRTWESRDPSRAGVCETWATIHEPKRRGARYAAFEQRASRHLGATLSAAAGAGAIASCLLLGRRAGSTRGARAAACAIGACASTTTATSCAALAASRLGRTKQGGGGNALEEGGPARRWIFATGLPCLVARVLALAEQGPGRHALEERGLGGCGLRGARTRRLFASTQDLLLASARSKVHRQPFLGSKRAAAVRATLHVSFRSSIGLLIILFPIHGGDGPVASRHLVEHIWRWRRRLALLPFVFDGARFDVDLDRVCSELPAAKVADWQLLFGAHAARHALRALPFRWFGHARRQKSETQTRRRPDAKRRGARAFVRAPKTAARSRAGPPPSRARVVDCSFHRGFAVRVCVHAPCRQQQALKWTAQRPALKLGPPSCKPTCLTASRTQKPTILSSMPMLRLITRRSGHLPTSSTTAVRHGQQSAQSTCAEIQ